MSPKPSTLLLACMLAAALVLTSLAPPVEAVTCDPSQLSPCAGAIFSSQAPSSACCSTLKQQKPCLCQYIKNPSLSGYINSGNGRRVASTCGVPFPRC